MSRVAVIGGGPAGMLCAANAAQNGHAVTLLEKNGKLGRKLYLTGKGRCNLTNAAELEEFFSHIPRNGKFLYSALYGFDNRAIIELVESMGVPTKTERGNRVFPVSDKSSDVLRALETYVRKSGAAVRLNTNVRDIKKETPGFLVEVDGQGEAYDTVVIATGGKSYPSTGSTGDGYTFAARLGHTVVPPLPSLVPLETVEDWPKELMGLSLRNVTLRAYRGKKKLYEELGEMLFTHFGVTGPLVLSAVSRFAQAPEGVCLAIDLKPGLSEEALDKRLLHDFEKNINRQFENALGELLPAKLIPVVVRLSGIPATLPVNEVQRGMRLSFCRLLKQLPMTVKRARPLEEAIITRGGVSVKEIDPSTMQSKLVPGLYFAGEVIDADATTGGYNLQIAYSTGALAGRSIP